MRVSLVSDAVNSRENRVRKISCSVRCVCAVAGRVRGQFSGIRVSHPLYSCELYIRASSTYCQALSYSSYRSDPRAQRGRESTEFRNKFSVLRIDVIISIC